MLETRLDQLRYPAFLMHHRSEEIGVRNWACHCPSHGPKLMLSIGRLSLLLSSPRHFLSSSSRTEQSGKRNMESVTRKVRRNPSRRRNQNQMRALRVRMTSQWTLTDHPKESYPHLRPHLRLMGRKEESLSITPY
jgi:hypothetical protein